MDVELELTILLEICIDMVTQLFIAITPAPNQ